MSDATDRRRALLRLLAFGVLLAVVTIVVHQTAGNLLRHPAQLADRLRLTPGSAIIFVVVYAAATSLALPATPFTLVGGVVFGVAEGTALNWLGASIGASGSFLLARWLGADAVRVLLGRHADKLDWLSTRTSTATILRLRLIPIVPFDGISVAAGLARVPLHTFVVGTAVGIIPGTFIYTWFANSLLEGATAASRQAFLQLAVAGTLLVLLSFLPNLVAKWRDHRRAGGSASGRP